MPNRRQMGGTRRRYECRGTECILSQLLFLFFYFLFFFWSEILLLFSYVNAKSLKSKISRNWQTWSDWMYVLCFESRFDFNFILSVVGQSVYICFLLDCSEITGSSRCKAESFVLSFCLSSLKLHDDNSIRRRIEQTCFLRYRFRFEFYFLFCLQLNDNDLASLDCACLPLNLKELIVRVDLFQVEFEIQYIFFVA